MSPIHNATPEFSFEVHQEPEKVCSVLTQVTYSHTLGFVVSKKCVY